MRIRGNAQASYRHCSAAASPRPREGVQLLPKLSVADITLSSKMRRIAVMMAEFTINRCKSCSINCTNHVSIASKPRGHRHMIGETCRRRAKSKDALFDNGPQSEVENDEGADALPALSAQDASSYILGMSAELRRLAEASGFRFLAYLLEMVFQEAFRLSGESGTAGSGGRISKKLSSGPHSAS